MFDLDQHVGGHKRILMAACTLLILCTIWRIGFRIVQVAQLNWANLAIEKLWYSMSNNVPEGEQLQDGIPDYWIASNWGHARAILSMDQDMAHTGKNSAYIKKNNQQDGSVFAQSFKIMPDQALECGVFYRGSEAFLQILGTKINTVLVLKAADTWAETKILLNVPVGENNATFILGVQGLQGEIRFDDAYCRSPKNVSQNLIINGGFEADGFVIEPVQWWAQVHGDNIVVGYNLESAYQLLSQRAAVSPGLTNRLNVVDLLLGRAGRVVKRMEQVSAGCLHEDGDPAPLLEVGREFQLDGNLTAYEKMVKLSIALMPTCPQSYARLAELYQSVNAFSSAARFYRLAAERALPGPQQGRYLFYAGEIYVSQTGEWAHAIDVLARAEQQSDWATADWYHGAVSIYLGEALTQAGRCAEAGVVYQTVLDCASCSIRHMEAQSALESLGKCTSKSNP